MPAREAAGRVHLAAHPGERSRRVGAAQSRPSAPWASGDAQPGRAGPGGSPRVQASVPRRAAPSAGRSRDAIRTHLRQGRMGGRGRVKAAP